jgi:hypothetical protein
LSFRMVIDVVGIVILISKNEKNND